MKYQAQVRTRLYSGAWSQWVDVGEPLTEAQAHEWACLQAKVPSDRVDSQVIVVGESPVSVLALIKGVFKKS